MHAFPNPLAELTYYRTYSRWSDHLGRRESWPETVKRYMDFMRSIVETRLTVDEYRNIEASILHFEVMPSMRLLWSAGTAAATNSIAAYNCSYLAPTRPQDLSEIMMCLMCGTGVGFSCEKKIIAGWPLVVPQTGRCLPIHTIGDSREGWATSLSLGITSWFQGEDLVFDYSNIRPKGDRIKTMGGRTSGPAPLQELLDFVRSKILKRQGTHLETLDAYDIICKIGHAISLGGVRRSALISLSDLDDFKMRDAKRGLFYEAHPYRTMANNSAVYTERPTYPLFFEEWNALATAGTGERGIFNRGSILSQAPLRRRPFLESPWIGTNPCGEIVLRSKQMCNLSEVVARAWDTRESLLKKIRCATILGTYQSLLTQFPYLSRQWKDQCDEERLLGVSISGIWDSKITRDPKTLGILKECAIATNREYAARFLIPASTAVTCIKPSGTVSQLVDCASGMHARFAHYYLRRVRFSATDPLFLLLRDQGLPVSTDDAHTPVLEFPIKAPAGAVVSRDLNAHTQLEHWLMIKKCFTEHNPSVTISVAKDEWNEVAQWLFGHWEDVGGLSFLPREATVYRLAPFEEITQEEYRRRCAAMPSIDFSLLTNYENDDQTLGAREYSCVGNACEFDPEEGSLPLPCPVP